MYGSANNSTSSCHGALDLSQMRRMAHVNTVFSALGAFSCFTALVLILLVKPFSSFVYRLMLYLAIVTLCLEVSIGLQSLPTLHQAAFYNYSDEAATVLREGWNEFCVVIAYVYQTLWFTQVFTIAWICVYVFALSVFKVALKEKRYHISGVCCIIIGPFSISWIPFVIDRYGFSPKSYVCWIIDSCQDQSDPMVGHLMQLFVSSLPAAVILTIGLVLLFIVVIMFCRRLNELHMRLQHWSVLREILPLLVYALFNCLITIVGCGLHILMMLKVNVGSPATVLFAFNCTFQSFTLFLPLSLFFHPSYKRKVMITLKEVLFECSKHKFENANTSTNPVSPHEPNEKDALIKKVSILRC